MFNFVFHFEISLLTFVRMRQGRWREGVQKLLFLGILASSALLVLRFALTQHFTYAFLWWNLALAMVPYGIALLAEGTQVGARRARWLLVPALILWLAFFPNAPYIFTDYIHLERLQDTDDWMYDAAMISVFAFTGFLFGLYSLFIVHEIIRERFGRWLGWATVVFVSVLGGYGVYLGRFPRWNSWDIMRHPMRFAASALGRLADPLQYDKLVLTTVLFTSFILVSYIFFRGGIRLLVRLVGERDAGTSSE